jgi:hypothetical protein
MTRGYSLGIDLTDLYGSCSFSGPEYLQNLQYVAKVEHPQPKYAA